jgi:hypothetical protein
MLHRLPGRHNRLEHFPEKHALAKAGVVTGFPSENATTQKD